ncbi:MAG: SDR family NAD(P)-dependent oxidoreductase [Candidatus Bathyarchaeia archaeon]
MKVLVTGGAGFIGHNTAVYLKKQGYEVVALDNLKRATQFATERLNAHHIPLVKGDILNSKALKKALAGVDVAVHAAAYISVKESLKKPALYFRNNVAGTANMAHACLLGGVKLLVYISSAAVYGNPSALPTSESQPPNPISPYGLTKLMGEEAVKFYAKQGLKHVILRLFNAYGPGQSGAYAGVITHFIERLSRGKPPIIHGDGQQTRDFIHVYDIAEAIKLCIEKGLENETLNIASGKPTAIKELAELTIKLVNPNLKPLHTKPRPGDIKHSHADISKAAKLLGFNPKISLEQGLKELLKIYPETAWNKP